MLTQPSRPSTRLIAICCLAAASAILMICTDNVPVAMAPILFIIIFTLAPNRR